MTQSVINVDPEIMGGTPVFRGTRVPIRIFVDYTGSKDGISDNGLNEFFDNYPGVSREQVIRFIEELEGAKEKILVTA